MEEVCKAMRKLICEPSILLDTRNYVHDVIMCSPGWARLDLKERIILLQIRPA
jgi:hypothetical protein